MIKPIFDDVLHLSRSNALRWNTVSGASHRHIESSLILVTLSNPA